MFDTLEYTNGAMQAGTPREQAEYQAQQLKEIINNDLVTKTFLVEQLKTLEVIIIKWMFGIGFSFIGLFFGIMGFLGKL